MKKLNALVTQLEEFKKSIEAKLNVLKGDNTKIKNRLKKLEDYLLKDEPKEVKANE